MYLYEHNEKIFSSHQSLLEVYNLSKLYLHICIKLCITLKYLNTIRKLNNPSKRHTKRRKILFQRILLLLIELKPLHDQKIRYNLFKKYINKLVLKIDILLTQEYSVLNL